ncbi:MAG: hypothetical protein K6G87_03580 [Butyrivibrio sp.]|uniref:hypothetical protein n=1 Tax=Butyrivibrio sp. TaxID=28121 RepID=UPI0025DD711D|nr:hypothetical protein [Butyrivibrio sp.]MCR5770299.1 hypothetical protein [Butyrivibrio sp.]
MKNKVKLKNIAVLVLLVLLVAAIAGVFIINMYHKNKSEEKRQYWQNVYAKEYFYTYDNESGELIISDPIIIEAMQKWDQECCSFPKVICS